MRHPDRHRKTNNCDGCRRILRFERGAEEYRRTSYLYHLTVRSPYRRQC
ncbi:MAG: hypothetical protein J0M12_07430 [Deltaproteobacteria bacterium]|nr:hypothetical protein [Deltaproteobacteria bacterium]